MPTGSFLVERYDPRLVALSIVIAVLASGAALDLAGRVSARKGTSRLAWLSAGALAMGLGIWSMHYTGMVALDLPVPIYYDVATVALSLGAAIMASSVALLVASADRLTVARAILGSGLMGGGIVAMHYIGMAAMLMPATVAWRPELIVLSAVIALLASAVALWLAFRQGHVGSDEWTWRKAGSAILMGGAISGMHYTGMAAAGFIASPIQPDIGMAIPDTDLGAVAIGFGTLFVLLAAIGSSIVDRRITAQALRLRVALAEVKSLRGLLPICATCKRIHSEDGSWQQVESYVRQRTDAQFTHSICPKCEASLELHPG